MKKTVSVVLLLFLILCLCGCSEASAGVAEAWKKGMDGSGELVVTKEKGTEEPAVVIPPTAIRLHVSFGPEFEVVMTDYLRILLVNPENSEAEALLTGLELTDRSYVFAFGDVLAAAVEQGYLSVGKTIKMTADAQDSVWTNATRELLMKPVDTFRNETGVLFGCHVRLPEAAELIQLDLSLLTKAERTTEEGHNVYYPSGAVSGHTAWRSVWNYSDGRMMEWYGFAIKGGSADISYQPDGSWRYKQVDDKSINEVWEGPNSCGYREVKGKRDPNTWDFIFESASGFDSFGGEHYFEDTYNAAGKLASRTRSYLDGSYEKVIWYDNGEFQTREYKGADGTYEATAFYPNGQIEYIKRDAAEGYYEEQRTEEGAFVYQKFADAGMTNVREAFYTEGKPVKVIIDGVTYEDQEMLSQFG